MDIIRVVKSRDYVSINNKFLQNPNLSLKAKGLLALTLSLPDDWNYKQASVKHFLKEGKDAFYATIKELVKEGYCTKVQLLNEYGQFSGTTYTFYELPITPITKSTKTENPIAENPKTENPETIKVLSDIKYRNTNVLLTNNPSNEELLDVVVPRTREKKSSLKKEEKDSLGYEDIIRNLWNDTLPELASIRAISTSRREKLRLRIKEMGGQSKAIETFREIFQVIKQSKFLLGINQSSWKATFDWVIANDKNWLKVLEGNYENTRLYSRRDLEDIQRREDLRNLVMRNLNATDNPQNGSSGTEGEVLIPF